MTIGSIRQTGFGWFCFSAFSFAVLVSTTIVLPSVAQEKISLLASVKEPHTHLDHLKRFAALVSVLTKERMLVQLDTTDQQDQVLERIGVGDAVIGHVPMKTLRRFGIVFSHDTDPLLATDYEMAKSLDRTARPVLNNRLDTINANLQILFTIPDQPRGFVSMTANVIKSQNDLKGRRVISEDALSDRQYARTGLSPMTLLPKDFGTALSRGAASTAIASLSDNVSTLLREQGRYYDLQIFIPKFAVIASHSWFGTLSDELQFALHDAARLAEAQAWRDEERRSLGASKRAQIPGQRVLPASLQWKTELEALRPDILGKGARDHEPYHALLAKYEPIRDPALACTIVDVLFLTNRNLKDASIWSRGYVKTNDGLKRFGSNDVTDAKFGVAHVSIPVRKSDPDPFREKCVKSKQIDGDLSKHRYLLEADILTTADFDSKVAEVQNRHQQRRARLGSSADSDIGAFVYVHGYANDFEAAVEMAAELTKRFGFRLIPVVLTWPSAGDTIKYKDDNDVVDTAIPHVSTLLERLLGNSAVDAVDIIAHSMGNRVMMPALSDLGQDVQWNRRLRAMISLAPDVDFDRFKTLAEKARSTAVMKTVYVSEDDRALKLSRRYHGNDRAGLAVSGKTMVVPGIDTVHVGDVELSFLGHSYQLNRLVQRDMADTIFDQRSPPNRHLDQATGPDGDFWTFP